MMIYAQIAVGGALGACLRFAVVQAAFRLFGAAAIGTLAVNIIGSFVMGLCASIVLERLGTRVSPFLITGVLGAFTTFSAFSFDAVRLMENGRIGLALTYMLGSVVASVLALWAGLILGRSLI